MNQENGVSRKVDRVTVEHKAVSVKKKKTVLTTADWIYTYYIVLLQKANPSVMPEYFGITICFK